MTPTAAFGTGPVRRYWRTYWQFLPGMLMAMALSACGGGGGGSKGGNPAGAPVISGTVSYEFVPPNPGCAGLDFAATELRPIRAATVQLVDVASGAILAATTAGQSGEYAFPGVEPDTQVKIRVRAELKRSSGTSTWDVEVRDNVDTRPTALPLENRPVYVLESAAFSSGSVDVVRNVVAETGWTGSGYGEPRAAAPFAVLDAIYSAIRFVVGVDPEADFPALDVFWSENNTLGDDFDFDSGVLPASFYVSDPDGALPFNPSLFLLGDAADDTEEFDDHVIVHEWGHYFEDVFSRSDSIGGAHGVGDRLDARVAFGEGWATAFAAMALDNPVYCDTGVPGTLSGFGIGAESGSWNGRGWYDEISVLRFIYDMFDAADDGGGSDTVAIGFGPIYAAMTGAQADTEAFTSIFSFAAGLRSLLDPAGQAGLDAQLAREDVPAAGLDAWGSNVTAIEPAVDPAAAGAPDVFPVYATDLVADGSPTSICMNSQFDGDRDGNKLAEHRFLRVEVTSPSRYAIRVETIDPPSEPPPTYDCTTAPATDPNIHLHSDPDVVMLGQGVPVLPFPAGLSCEPNLEQATTSMLSPGTYVLGLNEYRFSDPESPADFPRPGETQICFNVTLQATN